MIGKHKKTYYIILISSLFAFVYSTKLFADHPTVAFGSTGTGSINTISATPLPQGALAWGLQSEVISSDTFNTEQLETFANNGLEGVHSVDRIVNTSLSFAYGINDDFSLSARLPFIERKNIREGEMEDGQAEAHTHGDASGIGDLLVMAQYRIFNSGNTDIAFNFGIKSPTGESHEQDQDGIRFETEFQPGSGSWDFLLGMALSKKIGSFTYHANILYNKTSEGSQDTEIGDAFSYNAAITYRVNKESAHHGHLHQHRHTDFTWDIMLEINGEKRSKNKIQGDKEENSGGNVAFLSPGIRVSANKLGGYLSFGIPIVEDQNGKQTDVDYRIVGGISLAF